MRRQRNPNNALALRCDPTPLEIGLLWAARVILLVWASRNALLFQHNNPTLLRLTIFGIFVACPVVASFFYPRFTAWLSMGLAISTILLFGAALIGLASNAHSKDGWSGIYIGVFVLLWMRYFPPLLIAGILLYFATRGPPKRRRAALKAFEMNARD